MRLRRPDRTTWSLPCPASRRGSLCDSLRRSRVAEGRHRVGSSVNDRGRVRDCRRDAHRTACDSDMHLGHMHVSRHGNRARIDLHRCAFSAHRRCNRHRSGRTRRDRRRRDRGSGRSHVDRGRHDRREGRRWGFESRSRPGVDERRERDGRKRDDETQSGHLCCSLMLPEQELETENAAIHSFEGGMLFGRKQCVNRWAAVLRFTRRQRTFALQKRLCG